MTTTWMVAVKTKGKKGKRGYYWYYGHRLGYRSIASAAAEAQRIVTAVLGMGETVLSIVIDTKEEA